MKINLWYCQHLRPDLRDAMNDVANTVEYLIDTKLVI